MEDLPPLAYSNNKKISRGNTPKNGRRKKKTNQVVSVLAEPRRDVEFVEERTVEDEESVVVDVEAVDDDDSDASESVVSEVTQDHPPIIRQKTVTYKNTSSRPSIKHTRSLKKDKKYKNTNNETSCALDINDPEIQKLIKHLNGQGALNKHEVTLSPTAQFTKSAHEMLTERKKIIQELHTPCLDHYCEQLCWFTQFAFTIATFVLLGFYASYDHPAPFVNTFFVQSIAALAYFVKASHAGEVTINGTHIPVVRYVDWITTTPLMLYELCHIAHAETYATTMVIGCDILTLGLGITAAIIDQEKHFVVKYGLFACAMGFYILMVCTLRDDVAGPLYESANNNDDHYVSHDDGTHSNVEATIELFDTLELLTLISWSFYPVAVLLGRAHFGIVTQAAEDGFICILDIISKIGMEGIIIAYAVKHYTGAVDDDGHH